MHCALAGDWCQQGNEMSARGAGGSAALELFLLARSVYSTRDDSSHYWLSQAHRSPARTCILLAQGALPPFVWFLLKPSQTTE